MGTKFISGQEYADLGKALWKEREAEEGGQEVMPFRHSTFLTLLMLPGRALALLAGKVASAHDAHDKRIAELEERLHAVEGKGMRYRGTWTPDEQYNAGDFVTDGGSMWHCYASTCSRPGEVSTDWTLAVKKGRDGRDTR